MRVTGGNKNKDNNDNDEFFDDDEVYTVLKLQVMRFLATSRNTLFTHHSALGPSLFKFRWRSLVTSISGSQSWTGSRTNMIRRMRKGSTGCSQMR